MLALLCASKNTFASTAISVTLLRTSTYSSSLFASRSPSTVCAVCAEGYTRGVGYTCSECNGHRRNCTIGVALVLFAIAVAVGVFGVRYLGSSDEYPPGGRFQSRFSRSAVGQGLKIVIVSWQIVSQV